jgi:hypothetical protein
MTVTNYSAAANDRFASGFPMAPVRNVDPAFVGLPYCWSGVGWNPAQAVKGYGFVSPQHYLVARHFGGSANVSAFTREDVVVERSQASVEATEYGMIFAGQTIGDLSLGTLTQPMPSIVRYPVLDLNPSSTSNSTGPYVGLAVIVYGRGPNNSSSTRVAEATVASVNVSGQNHYIATERTAIQLETNDSGSPIFHPWTNPDGGRELAILGNHAAINEDFNFHNFTGTREVIETLAGLMRVQGYALRVVGNPSNTWVGSSSTNISRNSAWGIGGFPNATGATSDRFVLFNAATASSRNVSVNTNYNLRGIYFRSTAASGDPFTFGGGSVLTIGRGGLTNYDGDQQLFDTPLALGAIQYWSGGPGGFRINSLNTNGHLLEINTVGASEFTGAISGSGSLALEAGLLRLAGPVSHAGATWVHGGELRVDGSLSQSSSVSVASGAVLSGSGSLPEVRLSGVLSPGAGRSILTAPSVAVSPGAEFVFQFAQAEPDYGAAGASGNDLLRLTAANPFPAAFTSANRIRIFLAHGLPESGSILKGGFFTDADVDFLPSVLPATLEVLVPDASGSVVHEGVSYSVNSGPWELSTVAQQADFGSGAVSGRMLTLSLASVVSTGYAAWTREVFPEGTPEVDREPGADFNGDGVVNLIAYAMGLSPVADATSGLPVVVVAGSGAASELVVRFRRSKAVNDAELRVEHTSDFTTWTTFAGNLSVVNGDVDGDGRVELLEGRIPFDATQAPRFARVRAVLIGP